MNLQIGSIKAAPGKGARGYVHIETGAASVRLPIFILNGREPGPRLAVTAGVHGTEYVGVEALFGTLNDLDPEQLRGQLVACPLVNPPSFFERRIAYSPLDGINPNRVFPGQPSGRPTERLIAWVFENLIRTADVYLDLHGGEINEGMLPWTAYRLSGNDDLDRRAVEVAQAFGLPYLLRGGPASGGNSHAASTRAGVASVLVEIGGRGSRAAGEIAQVRDGLLRVMNHMGMREMEVPAPVDPVQRWRWVDFVSAPVDGLWYPEFLIGDDLAEGARIGTIRDLLGRQLAEISAPVSGKVFYGLRGLAVAAGDDLAAFGVPEED